MLWLTVFMLDDCKAEERKERTNCLVLTDDFNLYGFLASSGIAAINFNHVRGSYLLN